MEDRRRQVSHQLAARSRQTGHLASERFDLPINPNGMKGEARNLRVTLTKIK
jgi:hypothetical protein